MLHQRAALFEFLATQRTLVKHRLPMCHHVLLQEIVVTEFLLTLLNWTEHRQHRPDVCLLMKRQTGSIQESFVAKLTLERLVRKMRLHVNHKGIALREAFVTLVAFVRAFTAVDAQMRVE